MHPIAQSALEYGLPFGPILCQGEEILQLEVVIFEVEFHPRSSMHLGVISQTLQANNTLPRPAFDEVIHDFQLADLAH
jgi:hypothetical protein